MFHEQEQHRGLGGALYAVYGTSPGLREVRISRSPAAFLAAALRKARTLVASAASRKTRGHGTAGH